MRRSYLLPIFFLSIASSFAVKAAPNLVDNPGFAGLVPKGVPVGQWIYVLPSVPQPNPYGLVEGNSLAISLDDSIRHGSTRSIKIDSTEPVRVGIGQNLFVQNGQVLHVAVWMKGRGLDTGPDRGAWVRLGCTNSKNPSLNDLAYKASGFLKSTQSDFDWQLFETDVAIPQEADRVRLEFFLWNSKGAAWFSDPSVTVISDPSGHALSESVDKCKLARYREANEALPQTSGKDIRVVFMGDSITDLWNLDKYFPGKGYINRGVSGQSTAQMLVRFDQDVLALHPRIVWILAGTNDIAGRREDDVVANIRAMITACAKNNIHCLVGSILPITDACSNGDTSKLRSVVRPPKTILGLNRALADMCREENATFVDLHSKVIDDNGLFRKELTSDGLHPNGNGYTELSPFISDAIGRVELEIKPDPSTGH